MAVFTDWQMGRPMIQVDIRYISGPELARYFKAKNVDSRCSRCGENSWSLHDTEKVLGTASILVGSDGVIRGDGTDGYLSLVSMSCNNCGTIWSLLRGGVNAWLDLNPADIKDESEE
jgi:hypothetical protein